jgi:hypothetical protein
MDVPGLGGVLEGLGRDGLEGDGLGGDGWSCEMGW